MKRRKFLGVLGGSAIAAPAVAKQAIAEMPKGLLGSGGASMAPIGYPVETSSVGGASWKAQQIARLKQIISGEMDDEQKERIRRRRMYAKHHTISNHYAGMRSIADWKKLDCLNRDVEELERQIEKSDAQSSLWRILKSSDE